MQEHLKTRKKNAPPIPQAGVVNIDVVREGLAMVMDGLRVMELGGATTSKATPLFDGKMLLLPTIQVHDHALGYKVMDEEKIFTVDGVSVMEVKTEIPDTEAK